MQKHPGRKTLRATTLLDKWVLLQKKMNHLVEEDGDCFVELWVVQIHKIVSQFSFGAMSDLIGKDLSKHLQSEMTEPGTESKVVKPSCDT